MAKAPIDVMPKPAIDSSTLSHIIYSPAFNPQLINPNSTRIAIAAH